MPFLIYFAAFNILSIMCIPFSYFRVLLTILKSDYLSEDKYYLLVSRKNMLIHFIIWSVIGIPYLLYSHFVYDVITFYHSCMTKVDNRDTLDEISNLDYDIIKKTTEFFMNEHKYEVDL
jgi:hypothetical protein